MKRNKTWLAWALAVGLVAYLLGAATASRSVVDAGQTVRAYASGTALHADALQSGGTRVADVEAAFSAANVDSAGFTTPGRQTENEVLVQPNPADSDPPSPFVGKNASARGAGLEVSLGESVPVPPGSALALPRQRANATAAPDTSETAEVLGLTTLAPLAYASVLHADAEARWATSTCFRSANSPIAYSRGYAADLQLLDASQAGTTPLPEPIVATDHPDPSRNVIQTNSFVYAIPNGQPGKFGLVSEVHQTYAPISIVRGGTIPLPNIVIEVLGEWFVKATVLGVASPLNAIEYGVTDPMTGNPVPPGATVIRVSTDGGLTYRSLSIEDVMAGGQEIPGDPLLNLALGESPRAISAAGGAAVFGSAPTVTPTRVAGAVDVVRLNLLDGISAGNSVADLRIGHFESDLEVPEGGFSCPPDPTTTTSTTTTSTTTPTTLPAPPPTTAPPIPTTIAPQQAPPAIPIRAQPRTVG